MGSLHIQLIKSGEIEYTDFLLDKDRIELISNQFIKILEASETNSDYVDFYIQLIRNNIGLMKWVTERIKYNKSKIPAFHSLRDRQMSENLLWWINKFSNEKIIVMTSSYHAARDVQQKGGVRTMLDLVSDFYSNEMYSIAFICYEGKYGTIQPVSIGKRSRRSLEFYLKNKGNEYLFLDLADLIREKGKSNYIMYPSPLLSVNQQWSKVYNGVFFIRTMKPVEVYKVDSDKYFIETSEFISKYCSSSTTAN